MMYLQIAYTDVDTSLCKYTGEVHVKTASTYRRLGRRQGHHRRSLTLHLSDEAPARGLGVRGK